MLKEAFVGRVLVEAKIENALDRARARAGEISADQVRAVRVTDALVDTGASTLCLPASTIRQLGFTTPVRTRNVRTTSGVHESRIFGPVTLTVFDRDFTLDVAQIDDGCPILIGQLPLEYLQLVVDVPNHRLIPDPAQGGEWLMDLF